MYSVSLFGDDGVGTPAASKAAKPAQGLFGAKTDKASAPLPRAEQFARV